MMMMSQLTRQPVLMAPGLPGYAGEVRMVLTHIGILVHVLLVEGTFTAGLTVLALTLLLERDVFY